MANNATATANVNINANTQNAEQQITQLEGSIKVLDGAVNLVGGSLETIAGGLALTGALSKEQAEQFEGLAVGAIAFADGAKRTLDGVVNLQEGFTKLATNSKVAAVASRVLGAAIRFATGPIGIAVTAIGLIVAALVTFKDSLGVVGKAVDFVINGITKLTDAIGLTNSAVDAEIKKNKELADSQAFKLELLKAEGADRETLVKKERELLNTRIKAEKEGSEEQKKAIRDLALFNAKVRGENAKAQEDANKKAADERQKAAEKRKADEEKAAQDALAREQAFLQQLDDLRKEDEARQAQALIDVNAAIDQYYQSRLSQEEQEILAVQEKYFALQQAAGDNAEQLEVLKEAEQAALTDIEKKYSKERVKTTEEEQKAKDQLINGTIDNFQGALTALFGESKAVASANVLIDAAQAAVGIIKNSQSTGPLAIAYQVSQFALLAATTVASLRQINSAEPGGGGSTSTPKPSPIGGGAFTGALPGTGGTPTSGIPTTSNPQGGNEPIRAYVISQDVTNGQEASAAINRRRRLGGG
jgi:hypothetical protein